MTRVIAKFRSLSVPAKIGLGLLAIVVSGLGAYALFGRAAAEGVAGIGGIIASLFAIKAGRLRDETDRLAHENTERVEQNAECARVEDERVARESAAESALHAEELARLAGADDAGDPNRVLDRHSEGPGVDS